MADEKNGRVEPRLRHSGYGTGGTQERIDTLAQQQALHERLTRGRPREAFGSVLSRASSDAGAQLSAHAEAPEARAEAEADRTAAPRRAETKTLGRTRRLRG